MDNLKLKIDNILKPITIEYYESHTDAIEEGEYIKLEDVRELLFKIYDENKIEPE